MIINKFISTEDIKMEDKDTECCAESTKKDKNTSESNESCC
jgi:hypothetical protein